MNYQLTQEVSIEASRERGSIIGRAEFQHSEPAYQLRYRAADGKAVEAWWPESALSALPTE